MAYSADVIRHLNILLKNELTAINQYFLHSRIMQHQGYVKLADHEYQESIEEMKHADALIQRILLIGGLPNLQDMGKIRIGENVQEVLECDLAMEEQAQRDLHAAHIACEEAKDPISGNLVEMILESEEKHSEWLRAQIVLIQSMGIGNYLQTQV